MKFINLQSDISIKKLTAGLGLPPSTTHCTEACSPALGEDDDYKNDDDYPRKDDDDQNRDDYPRKDGDDKNDDDAKLS